MASPPRSHHDNSESDLIHQETKGKTLDTYFGTLEM
jgi:hypothetical protein